MCGFDRESESTYTLGWRPCGAILRPDTGIWWMSGGLGAFCAVPQGDNTVRLFVAGRDITSRSRIGVVTLQWLERPRVTAITPQPILDLGDLGTFDMDGVSYPWVIENGKDLWMYYVGWNRLGGEIPFRVQVGLAISKNGGRSFERLTRAPILPRTDEEPIGSASMWVGRAAGRWRMFYTNFLRWERQPEGARHFYHIREAYSADGINWDRPGRVVVDLIPPTEYALCAPDVHNLNGDRTLYFTARGDRYRLFAAQEAADGKWSRLPHSLKIPQSDFDSEMQCYSRTVVLGDRHNLLYCGNGYGRSGIGYAERACE
jgi:transposase